jgi:hypothetical protein
VLAEMSSFKPEPLDVFQKRNEQITYRSNEPLEFIVEGILPKIIVQISDEMDKAFLLATRKCVISTIKIGHGGALERGEQRLQKFRLAIGPKLEYHSTVVGKNLNVLLSSLDVDSRFVKMH